MMTPKFSGCRFLAVFCLVGLCVTAARPQDRQSTQEMHVLFIGNSFTYVNDLPKMAAELAKAGKRRPLRYEQETPGGYTLEQHWKEGKALAKIRSRQWDFVVLQDQSQAALLRCESMFDYGKRFDAEVKKDGSKTILYMTWASQDRPQDQPIISTAYQELSKELKAQVAPVGNAWAMALKGDQQFVLHAPDKKHPSATGTYLAACVFYATIYGKNPEGLPGSVAKLTDAKARHLQAIAWKAVQAIEKK